MARFSDKELDAYRDLVQAPGTFTDGFGWKTMLGALFVGLVMLPTGMYMSLAIGESVGPAAKWVTVILFLEMAKRARSTLSHAEIFILMAAVGMLIAAPTQHFFWNQFIVQSEAARSYGLTEMFPSWYAPTDPNVLDQHSFLMWEWAMPLGLYFLSSIVGRLDALVLGYGLFRITSDIEKLPFPLAPLGASGVTALAENQSGKEGWRWRCFSIGTALGVVFGFLYGGIPVLSSALGMPEPFRIFPIPWLDTSAQTAQLLPASPTGISFNMHNFFMGMMLPFFGVLGAFIAVLVMFPLNWALWNMQLLPSYRKGMSTVDILYNNNVDFYLSFGIGLAFAVALIGFYQVWRSLRSAREPTLDTAARAATAPAVNRSGRGDIRTLWVVLTYVLSSVFYILICGWLLDWNFRGSWLLWILVFFAFVYTPIISYVTARLEGLAGQAVNVPFIKEIALLFSGYRGGIDIWLLPIPIHNYGTDTLNYRTAELVGCSFRSIWKLNLVVVPIVFAMSVLYGQFIWSMGPVPSDAYPYAQQMWELQAKNECLKLSSTVSGYSPFMEALKPGVIFAGLAMGILVYAGLAAFGLPVLLLYGVVKGLGGSIPQNLILEMGGALFGRFVLARRFGETTWRQYAPVVAAGYFCGEGLIQMFCAGAKFLSASVFQLTY